jgi:hypothetical protein
VPQPSYEEVIVNDILIGLRYIPSNGIYTHQKLEDMTPTTTGLVPSEMLYIQVGDDYHGGGYEKIPVYFNDARPLNKLIRHAKKVRKSRLNPNSVYRRNGSDNDTMPPAYYPSSAPLDDSNNPQSSNEDIIIITTPDPYDIIMDMSPGVNESDGEERVYTRSSQTSNDEIVNADSDVNNGMSADEVNTTRECDNTTSLNDNEPTDVEWVLTRSSRSLNEDTIQEGVIPQPHMLLIIVQLPTQL